MYYCAIIITLMHSSCVNFYSVSFYPRSGGRKSLLTIGGYQDKMENIYDCPILNELMHSCVEEMEVLHPQVVKDNLLKFLSRYVGHIQ